MSGIAGINRPNQQELVKSLLSKISHRGKGETVIFSTSNSTMGIICNESDACDAEKFIKEKYVSDSRQNIHYASAQEINGEIEIFRDPVGAVPLYFGYTSDQNFCFASEIKSLIGRVETIKELPPGNKSGRNHKTGGGSIKLPENFIESDPSTAATKVHDLIHSAIKKRITDDTFGSWLSGGLDSSVIAAAADTYLPKLYTFAAGLKDSEDIKNAKVMSGHLKSEHHEVIINLNDLIQALPDVIYHLESFDALLVRSSIMNFLVTKCAADYVHQVFSGEGGDELFGGYHYLKNLSYEELPGELVKITNVLHNTALQRVDRSASAFGVQAHVPFLDPDVVDYVLRIPPRLKINKGVEKWILRKAFQKYLPPEILNRKKSKFWEGAGVQNLLAEYADKKISREDYAKHCKLGNEVTLRSKEEYMYYKIFEGHFGKLKDLSFLGFSSM